jgi:hypothetical protein
LPDISRLARHFQTCQTFPGLPVEAKRCQTVPERDDPPRLPNRTPEKTAF